MIKKIFCGGVLKWVILTIKEKKHSLTFYMRIAKNGSKVTPLCRTVNNMTLRMFLNSVEIKESYGQKSFVLGFLTDDIDISTLDDWREKIGEWLKAEIKDS